MLPALLGLIAAELAAVVVTVVVYRRRVRLGGFVEAVAEVDELVVTAVLAARRAQAAELSLAQRALLLEETRAALEQAATIMRLTPIPLQLAVRRGLPAAAEPRPQPWASPGESALDGNWVPSGTARRGIGRHPACHGYRSIADQSSSGASRLEPGRRGRPRA